MTDAFLATVISYSTTEKAAKVQPLIIEDDGTDHVPITVKPDAGILPETGDTVLVLTARNNLDGEKISRFYTASETNGRIVHVVKSKKGVFRFKGNYQLNGNLSVIAPDQIEFEVGDNLTFKITIESDVVTLTVNEMDLEIKLNPINNLPDVLQKSTGRSAFADGFMTAFGPTVSRIPGGNP